MSRRPSRPVSAQALEEAAFAYLARFEASAVRLRRVLMARVARSARDHGTDPEAYRAVVDELVARIVARGLVDDGRFARGRVASLRRKGASARAIRGRCLLYTSPSPRD